MGTNFSCCYSVGYDKWMTPLGLPGSVLFAGDSFSPETSHFEVVLPKTMDRNKFSGSMWIKPRTTVGDKILVVSQEILPNFFTVMIL